MFCLFESHSKIMESEGQLSSCTTKVCVGMSSVSVVFQWLLRCSESVMSLWVTLTCNSWQHVLLFSLSRYSVTWYISAKEHLKVWEKGQLTGRTKSEHADRAAVLSSNAILRITALCVCCPTFSLVLSESSDALPYLLGLFSCPRASLRCTHIWSACNHENSNEAYSIIKYAVL